jgi:hypothetical protein
LRQQKTAAPTLSEDKRAKQIKPLDFLVQRAAVDGTTCWRRVYQLGDKAELLAVVKQPEGEDGPIVVRGAWAPARAGAGAPALGGGFEPLICKQTLVYDSPLTPTLLGSSLQVNLTTDSATDIVLHWGVTKQGG